MTSTYIISLHASAGFTVLPRLALLFSRRRLKIERLEMSETESVSRFQIVLKCDGVTIERLVKQMWRIVEVMDVAITEKSEQVRIGVPPARADLPARLAL